MAIRDLAGNIVRLQAVRDELKRRSALVSSRQFIPHSPTPKQKQFLELNCLEAFFGGAAGGGKSDAILMAALQYMHVPGYSALILRRTFADLTLPGAIMDRSHSWLRGTSMHWDGLTRRWTAPSGASLTLGYCDSDNDRHRYQGSEIQFLGIDEAQQFPLNWYLYLMSRLRRVTTINVPIRARLAGNPGGIGHKWVFERFIKEGRTDNRVFVPSKLDDNPHLDRDAYRTALSNLDDITKAQLLDGLWVTDPGTLVYHFDPAKNLIGALPS